MNYYDQMHNDGVILSYKGAISQDILTEIGLSLRKKKREETGVSGRLLFSAFIELSQNVLIHSEEREFSAVEQKELGVGVVLVREQKDCYHLVSINKSKNEVARVIKERVDFINSLTPTELKLHYRRELRNPERSEKGGGNVGFIDMAKKTGNPVDILIKQIGDGLSYLTVTITVTRDSILEE